MPLPPPGNDVFWKDSEIDTPTFQLTPIAKPDMSPFLVHMPGRNAILSILQGGNAPDAVPQGCGYLQANVPDYDQGIFDAPVVCLSESPTFALDFFRYRSFPRWRADQRFGIGFDKASLVALGVRPVVYVEEPIRRHLIYLFNRAQENDGVLSDDPALNGRLNEMIERIYPLLFPLLEDHPAQGLCGRGSGDILIPMALSSTIKVFM